VTVYDARTGSIVARIARSRPESAMFSPDGKLLAVRTENGVRFHTIPSGGQTGRELSIGQRELAFIPGRHAILTTDGTSLEEWDIDTGAQTVPKLDAGTQTNWDDDDADVRLFAVSPDGRRLATTGGGYGEGMAPRLVLWDLERGTVIASQPFTDEIATIASIAFGNDVIATADDLHLRLFDPATLRPVGEVIKLDDSHDLRTTCTARVFADGSHAGAICNDAAFTFSTQIRDWRALALLRAR
jgi:WD40 repeat protein